MLFLILSLEFLRLIYWTLHLPIQTRFHHCVFQGGWALPVPNAGFSPRESGYWSWGVGWTGRGEWLLIWCHVSLNISACFLCSCPSWAAQFEKHCPYVIMFFMVPRWFLIIEVLFGFPLGCFVKKSHLCVTFWLLQKVVSTQKKEICLNLLLLLHEVLTIFHPWR